MSDRLSDESGREGPDAGEGGPEGEALPPGHCCALWYRHLFGLAKPSFGGAIRAALDRGSCAGPCDALPVHKLICVRSLRRLLATATQASVLCLAHLPLDEGEAGFHSACIAVGVSHCKRLIIYAKNGCRTMRVGPGTARGTYPSPRCQTPLPRAHVDRCAEINFRRPTPSKRCCPSSMVDVSTGRSRRATSS